jgi:hypothetical protein
MDTEPERSFAQQTAPNVTTEPSMPVDAPAEQADVARPTYENVESDDRDPDDDL